jgi:hypothetical protein
MGPLKTTNFFWFSFSCEQYGQPILKFDIDSEVLYIYRLKPRMVDFLRWLAAFGTTPVSRFLAAFS